MMSVSLALRTQHSIMCSHLCCLFHIFKRHNTMCCLTRLENGTRYAASCCWFVCLLVCLFVRLFFIVSKTCAAQSLSVEPSSTVVIAFWAVFAFFREMGEREVSASSHCSVLKQILWAVRIGTGRSAYKGTVKRGSYSVTGAGSCTMSLYFGSLFLLKHQLGANSPCDLTFMWWGCYGLCLT